MARGTRRTNVTLLARRRLMVLAGVYVGLALVAMFLIAWLGTYDGTTAAAARQMHATVTSQDSAATAYLTATAGMWIVVAVLTAVLSFFVGRGWRLAWAVALVTAVVVVAVDGVYFLLLAWHALTKHQGYATLILTGFALRFQIWVGDALWTRTALADGLGWRRRRKAPAEEPFTPSTLFAWPEGYQPTRPTAEQ